MKFLNKHKIVAVATLCIFAFLFNACQSHKEFEKIASSTTTPSFGSCFFPTLYFKPNSTKFDTSSNRCGCCTHFDITDTNQIIEYVAWYVQNKTNNLIRVHGSCNTSEENSDTNWCKLRAQKVAALLIKKGVDKRRILIEIEPPLHIKVEPMPSPPKNYKPDPKKKEERKKMIAKEEKASNRQGRTTYITIVKGG